MQETSTKSKKCHTARQAMPVSWQEGKKRHTKTLKTWRPDNTTFFPHPQTRTEYKIQKMKPDTRFGMLPRQTMSEATTGTATSTAASVTASVLAQARDKLNLPQHSELTGKLKPHAVLMEEGRSLLACLMKMNQQRANGLETKMADAKAPPSPKKRSAESGGAEDQGGANPITVNHKRRRTRKVSWDDDHRVFPQEDMSKKFSDYDESEIWYGVSTSTKQMRGRRGRRRRRKCCGFDVATDSPFLFIIFFCLLPMQRKEYDLFMVDRLRTVQCLRASGGNEKALNPEFYCVRGLEPFQTADIHQQLHSKRRFHQSTIMIEQVRQNLLGIRDPERYRMLVSTQSELSAQRAQELAALDEHEVHNRVMKRTSLVGNVAAPGMQPGAAAAAGIISAPSSLPAANKSDGLSPSSISERIRRLQEMNARRLMELYSQPGNNPFKFPVRRDSLVGLNNVSGRLNSASATTSSSSATSSGVGELLEGMRFPLRRDSLTPSSYSG